MTKGSAYNTPAELQQQSFSGTSLFEGNHTKNFAIQLVSLRCIATVASIVPHHETHGA
jgi:hypothetical protein